MLRQQNDELKRKVAELAAALERETKAAQTAVQWKKELAQLRTSYGRVSTDFNACMAKLRTAQDRISVRLSCRAPLGAHIVESCGATVSLCFAGIGRAACAQGHGKPAAVISGPAVAIRILGVAVHANWQHHCHCGSGVSPSLAIKAVTVTATAAANRGGFLWCGNPHRPCRGYQWELFQCALPQRTRTDAVVICFY